MFFEKRLEFFREHKVVNWHEHVWFDSNHNVNEFMFNRLIGHADLVGVDTTVVSLPLTGGYNTPEQVELANDTVRKAVARYPEKMRGLAFIDPINGRYALSEIERCINDFGFVGVKMYHQFFLDDPAQYPIVEKCIELNVPILMHAGKLNQNPECQPRLSDSTHFLPIAKRYPEATFIMAHISGGGDWFWQLKGMEECKNVFTDFSGSVFDNDHVERTLKVMGAERTLFGTDGSYSAGIGKVLSADITDDELKTILNNPHFEKYLERGGK